jgi:hypothetical protein
MSNETPARRLPDEIRDLIERLIAQYDLGGPRVGPGPNDYLAAWESHFWFVADLNDAPPDDPAALQRILRESYVTTPATLLAMLRLIGSNAALHALGWALGEPADAYHATADDVLREARPEVPSYD